MPSRKFWLVTWGAEDDDNPYGMGLGHQLWWPVYLKRNGARFWAAYLDRFGVPTTKAVYPSDESDAENEKRKKDALAAALSLRSEGAVALPEGFDVSLVESTSPGKRGLQGLSGLLGRCHRQDHPFPDRHLAYRPVQRHGRGPQRHRHQRGQG